MIANFMNQNISVNNELRKYRRDLNSRYPDPTKKDPSELAKEREAASPSKTGKKDAKKEAPKKPDPKKKDSKLDTIV